MTHPVLDLDAIRAHAVQQIDVARTCCKECAGGHAVDQYRQDILLCDTVEQLRTDLTRVTADAERLHQVAEVANEFGAALADLLNCWHPADRDNPDEWVDSTEVIDRVKDLVGQRETAIRWAVQNENDERQAVDALSGALLLAGAARAVLKAAGGTVAQQEEARSLLAGALGEWDAAQEQV